MCKSLLNVLFRMLVDDLMLCPSQSNFAHSARVHPQTAGCIPASVCLGAKTLWLTEPEEEPWLYSSIEQHPTELLICFVTECSHYGNSCPLVTSFNFLLLKFSSCCYHSLLLWIFLVLQISPPVWKYTSLQLWSAVEEIPLWLCSVNKTINMTTCTGTDKAPTWGCSVRRFLIGKTHPALRPPSTRPSSPCHDLHCWCPPCRYSQYGWETQVSISGHQV